MNLYKILEVKKNASQERIRQSFKHLAWKYHPNISNTTSSVFSDINMAYGILKDEEKRGVYDLFGSRVIRYLRDERACYLLTSSLNKINFLFYFIFITLALGNVLIFPFLLLSKTTGSSISYTNMFMAYFVAILLTFVPISRTLKKLLEKEEYRGLCLWISMVFVKVVLSTLQIFLFCLKFDKVINFNDFIILIPFYILELVFLIENILKEMPKENGRMTKYKNIFCPTLVRFFSLVVFVANTPSYFKPFAPFIGLILTFCCGFVSFFLFLISAVPVFLYGLTISLIITGRLGLYVFIPIVIPYLVIIASIIYLIYMFIKNLPKSYVENLELLALIDV